MTMHDAPHVHGLDNAQHWDGTLFWASSCANEVLSICQAVQLVGMNQEILQQSWQSLAKMVDQAIATFHEMWALELDMDRQREETEEDKQWGKWLMLRRSARHLTQVEVGWHK
jgi:hypothetical protein